MSIDERTILQALAGIPYPGFTRDIVAAGAVRRITIEDGRAVVELELGGGASAERSAALCDVVRGTLLAVPGIVAAEVKIHGLAPASSGLKMADARPSVPEQGGLDRGLIPEVRHAVAVASGKGGVGKSTVAVNLALALARQGRAVGLLDADIYGPSIPLMTGITEAPRLTPEGRIVPFERYGIRIMSLGFLVDPEQAVIWRGPMVMKAIEQLLRDVVWGALDVLVVDLPPGTGDAQLTISQKIRLAGAVIVTTPQDVALADAIKGVAMFRKVAVPVLGLIENMSYFVCPHCSGRTEIFDHGGGRRQAARLAVPFLGEIPLEPAIREGGDRGEPIVAARPDSAESAAFMAVATQVLTALGDDAVGHADSAAPDRLLDRLRRVFKP